ncbi:MAG: tetratricopeptide repeat protein [Ignavibacteria bacterium]|nr:tetratricopeptide repeat protein [Ignavibacteria bacterium]
MNENNPESLISKSKEYLLKAYHLQMDGKFEEAILNYKKSLNIHPTPEAHTYLGWTYSFIGDFEKAIDECKTAISLDPEFGNPYNDIGAYLLQQGKPEEALTWLELALNAKRFSNKHFALLNIGKILEQKGLWFEALSEYRKSMESAPEYVPAKQNYNRLQGMLN